MKSEQDLIRETNTFQVIVLNGHKHVLYPFFRDGKGYPQANYLGTGLALAGILKRNQTLDQFKAQWIKDKILLYNDNSQFVKQTAEEKEYNRNERGVK